MGAGACTCTIESVVARTAVVLNSHPSCSMQLLLLLCGFFLATVSTGSSRALPWLQKTDKYEYKVILMSVLYFLLLNWLFNVTRILLIERPA